MTVERAPTTTGRIRRLRTLIERPADVWLLCRMLAWAVVLPLLKRLVRLDRLAQLMWADLDDRTAAEPEKIVALSGLLTRGRRNSHGTCYERSLLAYRFLSAGGTDPKLLVGVRRYGGAVLAHAWVTVGSTSVGEPDATDAFVPVVVYGRGGVAET